MLIGWQRTKWIVFHCSRNKFQTRIKEVKILLCLRSLSSCFLIPLQQNHFYFAWNVIYIYFILCRSLYVTFKVKDYSHATQLLYIIIHITHITHQSAGQYGSWLLAQACASSWRSQCSEGCLKTCWPSQLHDGCRSCWGLLRRPCRHHQ